MRGQQKNPRPAKGKQIGGRLRLIQNGVGRDYCIPSSFRREHQFMCNLLPTTINIGII